MLREIIKGLSNVLCCRGKILRSQAIPSAQIRLDRQRYIGEVAMSRHEGKLKSLVSV